MIDEPTCERCYRLEEENQRLRGELCGNKSAVRLKIQGAEFDLTEDAAVGLYEAVMMIIDARERQKRAQAEALAIIGAELAEIAAAEREDKRNRLDFALWNDSEPEKLTIEASPTIEEGLITMLYEWQSKYPPSYKPEYWLMGIEEALQLGFCLLQKQYFSSLLHDIPSEFMGLKVILKTTPGIELGFSDKAKGPLMNELYKTRKEA